MDCTTLFQNSKMDNYAALSSYEENTFRKEVNGDLTLAHSEYGTDNPPESELPASE